MHGDVIWHFDHNKHPACYACCEQHVKKHAHAYAFQLQLQEGHRACYVKLSGATVNYNLGLSWYQVDTLLKDGIPDEFDDLVDALLQTMDHASASSDRAFERFSTQKVCLQVYLISSASVYGIKPEEQESPRNRNKAVRTGNFFDRAS